MLSILSSFLFKLEFELMLENFGIFLWPKRNSRKRNGNFNLSIAFLKRSVLDNAGNNIEIYR